ncbi:MAG: AAA family ATPase [Chloroflexota bacterium]|nr:AAA family ATPase [Chloroflexota bacterium]
MAERRLVSVLFADLVGFTPFAEERDAEEVRETLSRYFELARETVERYGGTVEKFIGDAVMAVWGTPTAREDDAERAVRAALELTQNVGVLGEAIQARAGVLTGEAAVTIGATDQGMVAGDIVNTAARLQGVAEPGTVLVGESTMRAASAAIAFEEAGDATLKGKASPVPAFRALRVVAERGGRNRAGSLEPPFVGREEELRELKDQYHAVTREGRARLVSIMGPAGIGKSRLAWEFSKYTDGLVEEMWWHSGRSPAYGEGITFWALGEMIRRRAGLVEADDESTTRARVTEMLVEHVPDDAERAWIEPAMLTLLGIGEQDGGSEQHFAAWRTFFERMSETGPVALVFEDLHWADSGLLDFIDHLLEWSRDRPIYIVTLARPELLEKRPTWGAGKRQFLSLFLEPLPEPAMRALLGGLIPGLPDAAMREIIRRADGVPLYAVETVRMLVADGRLEERDGVYAPTRELSDLAIPETLTALIASRLDALEAAERALLQDASVLGQSFTPEALAAVTQVAPEDLEPRLRSLVRRELLVLRADPRAPDRGQYAFVQSLIREVAYNTLARADRKSRHLAAARHFESLPTDELAGALAGHYLAAHLNAPEGPEADALGAQARIALKVAAERASSLGAHDQAMRFLVQAISVTSDHAEQAELEERAGEAASAAGRIDDALAHFGRARAARETLGDRAVAVRVIASQARALTDVGRAAEAVRILEGAREEFADLAGEPGFVQLEGQRARAYFFVEQPARAVETAEQVLDAAEHLNLRDVIADTLITKGTALAVMGRPREGLMLIAGGGELATEAGRPAIALRAAVNRSTPEALNDPRAGFESSRTGLALARRLGLRNLALVLLGNAAEFALRIGEWDWAMRELESVDTDGLDPTTMSIPLTALVMYRAARGEDIADDLAVLGALEPQIDDPSALAGIEAVRADTAFFDGRFDESRARMRRALELTEIGAAEALVRSVRTSLWLGDVDAARESLAAVEASGAFGRAIDALAASVRAGIAAAEGRIAEAVAIYRDAIRTHHDLGAVFDEALTALDMVALLPGSLPEVREAEATARSVLTRLGATAVIDRLDEFVARSRAPAPTAAAMSERRVPAEPA